METILRKAFVVMSACMAIGAMAEVLHVDNTEPGMLREVLGERINTVDSLEISGQLGESDFGTLFDASCDGELRYIDMHAASVDGDKIPDNAFWDENGFDVVTDHRHAKLQCILLPESIEEIGSDAFCVCLELERAVFPASLRTIGDGAFCGCAKLKGEKSPLPQNLETIGGGAFAYCYSLESVTMPSTLRYIGAEAFLESRLKECVLNDGLEEIGNMAFASCDLSEVVIPQSCRTLTGSMQFFQNPSLKSLVLPDEGWESIPEMFAWDCSKLESVNIPSTVKHIDNGAFDCCSLRQISLPEGLLTLGKNCFNSCKFTSVVFPSTVIELGPLSCQWHSPEAIYVKATVPPTCCFVTDYLHGEEGPFGPCDVDDDWGTPHDIPVYVPIGCADAYRNAPGWDYFTNFVETDTFPEVDALATVHVENPDNSYYDLSGRKVVQPIDGQIYIINRRKVQYRR